MTILCSGVGTSILPPLILRVVIFGKVFQRDWRGSSRWYEPINQGAHYINLTPISKERLILQLYDSYKEVLKDA
jgi:hypothetical protein